MRIKYGNGKTEFGTGVQIDLTGDEVATAIDAFLVANGVNVQGPRTITVNGELCDKGMIYVDPSGWVSKGFKVWDIHHGATEEGLKKVKEIEEWRRKQKS